MGEIITYTDSLEGKKGVSVEIVGRGGLRYREASHEMLINFEFLATGAEHDMVLYTRSVRRWKPPYADEIINDEKRKQIIGNICELLTSRGARVDLD